MSEYGLWMAMRRRCYLETVKDFKPGFSVCERWDEFWLFLEDMGRRPSDKHCLRIKKGCTVYNKDNCFWSLPPKRNLERQRMRSRWANMIKRCGDNKSTSYIHYGGRGISVCDEWQDFEKFYSFFGDLPKGVEIDRIDNNLGYYPDNVRLVDRLENMNNTRRCVKIDFKGKKLTISQIARQCGLSRHVLEKRLKTGWALSDATQTPLMQKFSNKKIKSPKGFE